MARYSHTGNVRKLCGCKGWKTCVHPWYLDFRPMPGGQRVRRNLDELAGHHALDIVDAKREAQRAMVAIRDHRDPKDLQAGDRPTLAHVLAEYLRRPATGRNYRDQVPVIVRAIVPSPAGPRAFGDWRAADVTRDTLEAFRAVRPLVAGNRNLSFLRALFNWAVLRGLVPTSPFKVGSVAAVKMAREEARTRRLHPGEDEQLHLHAGGWLRNLITAALESGCREGELLSLQWHQVRFSPKAELFLPAPKTKAKKDRRVPISSTLQAVLEARRHDPAGHALPPTAFVFGDAIGRRVGGFQRAWHTAVLKAHGHTPTYTKTANLTKESRAALAAIGLHFHDLRREAGSRWMDAGVPLATIQRWLGHSNIAQTSTYLAASLGGDADEMRAFEARIGRHGALPTVAHSAGSDGALMTPSDRDATEKTEQTLIVH